MGGNFSQTVDREVMTYSATVLKDHVPKAMEVLAGAVKVRSFSVPVQHTACHLPGTRRELVNLSFDESMVGLGELYDGIDRFVGARSRLMCVIDGRIPMSWQICQRVNRAGSRSGSPSVTRVLHGVVGQPASWPLGRSVIWENIVGHV